ncbi:MAG: YdeI/OmpD-associated family protein [Oscillospiraceae bacterium]|jgi:uncharacterized protein YdeI (YjbR/CyaY-like superfamily)|nr:YdeI/OmpD-associated family protein [Oscillospiraceae bacterium]
MKTDKPELLFTTRGDFREWLSENAETSGGVWLIFGKIKTVVTLTANDALEESLCFGWIDGQMQSVDEKTYLKYFKQRANNSDWSEKNKKLVIKLEQDGLMTDLGRAKVEYAKQNGLWDTPKQSGVLTDDMRIQFEEMLNSYETAYANFLKMPRSVRKSYTASYYLGAKTEVGKQKRFNAIVERLNLNLNPMESMKKAVNP